MELRFVLLEAVNAAASPQWIYFRVATVLTIFFAASALSPLFAKFIPAAVQAIVTKPACFYSATILLVSWLRFPGLLSPHLNPDEAQFTAAAAKLLIDPVFWRSVDTGSSGPLNVFPLTLPHLLGWAPDYATSRVIGLLMLLGSVLLLHRTLACLYSDVSARLALIPLVFSVGFFQDPDYVHYSSEHGPLLLLSSALYFICRISTRSQSGARWLPFASGLLLGSIPYAKLQGLPMAAALALIFLHVQWTEYRRRTKLPLASLVSFATGALLPTAAVLVFVNHFDLWKFLWESYVQTNFLFYSSTQDRGHTAKLNNLLRLILEAREMYPLFFAAVLLMGWFVMNSFFRPSSEGKRADGKPSTPVLYAILYIISALFSVGRPGNAFLHYTLLLLAPLGFLLGTIIGEYELKSKKTGNLAIGIPAAGLVAVAGAMLAVGTIRLAEVYGAGNPYLRRAAVYLDSYRGPVSSAILKVAEPGSRMTVWGWSPELYVETGLTQATRYGSTLWQTTKSPLQKRFMSEFVDELETSRPEVFVDAMSPHMFHWIPRKERANFRYEAFPSLRAAVSSNYELADEVNEVRIYRRKPAQQLRVGG